MDLFTIGYEGLDQDRFLALLVRHGIDGVADIRKVPSSRKKGFAKAALKEFLESQHIAYINFQDLGAPRSLRDELYRSGSYERFFAGYRKAIADQKDPLRNILLMLRQGRKVCLLCFERDPNRCHRKVVAEELKKMNGDGLEVRHIVPV